MEESGNWPVHLLDAHIVMIPKEGDDETPIGQRPLICLPLFLHAVGHSQIQSKTTALDIEECLGSEEDDQVHTFVADVVKSFDTEDRSIVDCVLSGLGLPVSPRSF